MTNTDFENPTYEIIPPDILVMGTHHSADLDMKTLQEVENMIKGRSYLMLEGTLEESVFRQGVENDLIYFFPENKTFYLEDYHQGSFVEAMKSHGVPTAEIIYFEALSSIIYSIQNYQRSLGPTSVLIGVSIGDNGPFDIIGRNAYNQVREYFDGIQKNKWDNITTPVEAWNTYVLITTKLFDEENLDLAQMYDSWMSFSSRIRDNDLMLPKAKSIYSEKGGNPVIAVGKFHTQNVKDYFDGKRIEISEWMEYVMQKYPDGKNSIARISDLISKI